MIDLLRFVRFPARKILFFTVSVITLVSAAGYVADVTGFHIPVPYHTLDLTAETTAISSDCPSLSSAAIQTGLEAFSNAKQAGLDNKNILTIVDFSQPEYNKRFCTVDLRDHQVLFNEVVAHGVGSGATVPDKFSNNPNSHASSLGMYVTGDTYYGKDGYSLHIYGLDHGLNDNAASRHVVVHGTPHVSDLKASVEHRIGHTLGCFGLSQTIAPSVIHTIEGGTLIFAYYPSQTLLQQSAFLQNNQTQIDRAVPENIPGRELGTTSAAGV